MSILLSCPAMMPLAVSLCALRNDLLSTPLSWSSFSDGFPRLELLDPEALRNQDIVFLSSMEQPGDIFFQLSLAYDIPRYAIRSLTMVLPYFPTGTMERMDRDGQVATAATLAKMISAIPLTMSGPAQVIIFDIHALQERFYFSDRVIPRLESAVPLLRRRLAGMKDVSIAFPDEGAWKRFGRYFADYPQVVCFKVREGSARHVRIKEGDPDKRNMVVVDDLVMSGNTLLECRHVLDRAGAQSVSAFVTHGVFPNRSWKHFPDSGMHRFWCTDSCPGGIAEARLNPLFEILSLDELLAALV